MTELRRLCDFSASPRARELLRAGIEDGPQPAALRKTALALGIGGAGVTIATSAGAAAATSAVAPGSLATIAAKWIAIGTLGGFALAGGASAVSSLAGPAAAPREAGSAAPSLAQPQPPSLAPALAAAAAAAIAPDPVLPSVPAASGAPTAASTRAASPPSAPPPDRSAVAAQVAKIDAARSALGRGDARAALQQLDEYGALERTGTLDREAQLLRIDALLRAGERELALGLAERYLGQFPGDPHAARLRALRGDRSRSDATTIEER